MSLYPVVLLLGCFFYVTAFHEPDPVNNPRDAPKVIRPTYRPNNVPQIIRPTYNPKKPATILRLRRFVDGSQRFDGQNPQQQQKRPDWEVKPDLSREKLPFRSMDKITISKPVGDKTLGDLTSIPEPIMLAEVSDGRI